MAYPDFIFQDAVPAQQMIEHERAFNEGLRIQELGKARQAEALFRTAQLRQQAQQQQETNQLNQLIAQSRIAQDQIGNSFRERELAQQERLAGERNKNYLEGLRIQYPHGSLSGTEAAAKAKIDYDRELSLKEEAADKALMTEWQSLQNDIDTLTESKKNVPTHFSLFHPIAGAPDAEAVKKLDEEINRRRARQASIEQILAPKGKVPSMSRVPARGLAAIGAVPPVESPAIAAPQISPLAPLEEAQLSPFDMRLRGVNPGDVIEQGGQRYRVSGSLPATALAAPATPPAPANPLESAISQSLDALGISERQVMPISRGGYSQRNPVTLAQLLIPKLQEATNYILSTRGAGMADAQQRVELYRSLISKLQTGAF